MKVRVLLSLVLPSFGLFLVACSPIGLTSPETPISQQESNLEQAIPLSADFRVLSAPFKSYDAASAVSYARKYYNTAYTSSGNLFSNFDSSGITGGNCTNFVSQALMAGLLRTDSNTVVFNNRKEFDADTRSPNLQWYFFSMSERGSAWAGAHNLYQYATGNLAKYKGLHFQYITHDTRQSYLKYELVKAGDVIFADWEGDGKIDHAMLVTEKKEGDWWTRLGYSGYNRIRVTYQSNNKTDVGLGDLNEQKQKKALFYVYRPVDYNPKGL